MIVLTIFLGVLIILYEAGHLYVLNTELEYRAMASFAGQGLLVFGIPFLILLWIIYFFLKNPWKTWKTICTVIMVIVFAIWSFMGLLSLVFSISEEHTLVEKYIVVDTLNMFMEPARWETYETVNIFFRKKTEYDNEIEKMYLSQKYHEEFTKTWLTDNMLSYCKSDIWKTADHVWVSEKHPEVPIIVTLNGYTLTDNYVETVCDNYLFRAKQNESSENMILYNDTTGRYSLFLEEDQLELTAEIIADVMQTISKDDLFVEHRGTIPVYTVINEKIYYNQLPFGKMGKWDYEEPAYYMQKETLLPVLKTRYEQMKMNAKSDGEYELELQEQIEQKRLEESENLGNYDEVFFGYGAKCIYDDILK